MSGPLDYLPELDELSLGDLPVIIEVDRVEELVGRDLPEAHLRPVLLRLAPIDRLVPVLVEDLEHVLDQLLQVVRQLLYHRQCWLVEFDGLITCQAARNKQGQASEPKSAISFFSIILHP